jgi:ammonium transporter, Amt family
MMSKTSLQPQAERRGYKSVPRWAEKLLAVHWFKRLPLSWQACVPISLTIVCLWNLAAVAQTAAPPDPVKMAQELKVGLDTAWVMIAAMLVIFMNAGFCMLEAGMCRQKNAVNVLAKNLIVFALSTIAFWAIGFGLMFSDGNGFIGSSGGFFLSGADNSPAMGADYKGIFSALNWTGVPLAAKFFFQLAFAGTAATIVSGAVAERIKFVDFLLFSLLFIGIAYPITGHWIWGAGWLAKRGFYDFAGSTVVHTMGGVGALMGAIFLGPRLGRYKADGTVTAMPGHNMAIATLGCLILWLGWFGFNPGSTMSVGNGAAIAHIALTTNTAGAFGGVAATVIAWLVLGKPDLSMVINGILAGLVAVTASCAFITLPAAAVIGTVAGILVVFAVSFFDKVKVDDPVGAVSVHLVNGVWGTIALGLFAVGIDNPAFKEHPALAFPLGAVAPNAGLFYNGGFGQLWTQIVGVVSVVLMTAVLSAIFWGVLKAILGIRVTAEEEFEGLDISEHGMEAYSGFAKEAMSTSPSMGFDKSSKFSDQRNNMT